jgi:hypothetical protein
MFIFKMICTTDGCLSTNEPLCSSTGDYICDTPQVDDSALQSTNCLGQMTNWQNFMHYSDQYANFTVLQVDTMVNAMNHVSRSSLWTQTNLDATGTAKPPKPTTGFNINAGLNGSWYNPATSGQGFYIEVLPDLGLVSLAWFTYDTERPDESVPSNLGGAGQRWLTALGSYAGDTAVLDIEITKGGIFDQSPPLTASDLNGTIIFKFNDCKTGTLTYDIPQIGRQNTIPVQRIAFDNVALCQAIWDAQ